MRRGPLLALALMIVVAATVAAIVAFPTRYGCSDGDGTFTTSQAVAESSCGSTATRFVTDAGVVSDQRVVPRGVVALIGLVALVVLFRFAARPDVERDPPETWRPYG